MEFVGWLTWIWNWASDHTAMAGVVLAAFGMLCTGTFATIQFAIRFFRKDDKSLAMETAVVDAAALMRALRVHHWLTGRSIDQQKEHDGCTRLARVQRGLLRIGVSNYPPFNLLEEVDGSWEAGGLYGMLLKEVCRQQSLNVQIFPVAWHSMQDDINSGKMDAMLGIFQTTARTKYAGFCNFMHSVYVGAVCLKGRGAGISRTMLSQGNVTIGVVEGEVGFEIAKDFLGLEERPEKFVVQKTGDIKALSALLLAGAVDYCIVDSLSCRRIVKSAPDELEELFVDDPLEVCQMGILYPQGDVAFGQWLAEVFHSARQSHDIVRLEADILNGIDDIVKVSF